MTNKPNQQEQWGNIELPGLSDEELFNTNWTRKSSHLEHSQRVEQWHKDPEFRKKWYEAVLKNSQDPNYRKKFLIRNQEKLNDPKFWQAYYAGIKRREQDKTYHKRRLEKANAVICRKVQTPLGIFDSITEAAKAHGMSNTEKMRYRLKSDNFPDYLHLDNNVRPKTKK